ncbi:MAG TPA: long-chain fatty acid--CoA ligase [Streptosporangiaceae bacterium]|nr:long-chain fatty acid--CoA ligase [Streptosporangiaceae bacterium]
MTTTHAGDLDPAIAAERESIEAEIAGGTLLTAFAETAERRGGTEAYRWCQDGQWRTLTYAGLRDQVREAALGLAAIGLRPGDFAVIWSRNRPEANIADMAVMHARGVPVFLYNTLAPGQAAYIAGHCEATVAIVEDRGFLTRLEAVRAQLPQLRQVMLIDGEPGPGEDWLIAWDAVLAVGRAEAGRSPGLFEATWRRVGPEDLAALIYTSGTTGPPKGVMITHHNVRYCAAAVLRVLPAEEFADQDGRRGISFLPMAHAAGRFSDHWLPMISDATVAFCPDPMQLFQVAAQVRPTVLVGVPRVWEKLHAALRAGIAAEPDAARRRAAEEAITTGRELARWRQRGGPAPAALHAQAQQSAPVRQALLAFAGLDACRLAVSGAAPIDPAVIEFFQALGLPMAEGWGMTELTNAATVSHPGRARTGAVGTACPGVEVRLADDGEVLVRGPLVMRGYYRDPAGTAGALDRDGWLHTGDIGTLDAGGFLTIVDRKKELIITSGGKNISPALIESLLQRHPLIGQACAIGDRRHYVTALLVLDGEAAPVWAQQHGIGTRDLAGLAAHPRVLAEVAAGVRRANQDLARAEQVRRFTLLPAEWTAETGELTPTLKRRRRVIAERYAADIDRLYGPPGPGVIDMIADRG